MAGTAGGSHPSDGGGGGGGGGPDGSGGNYGSGDYNGVTGTDGSDTTPAPYPNSQLPAPDTSFSGSYGNGYVSITYEDLYGVLFNEGKISFNPPGPDAPNPLVGTITHVFFQPTVITLTSAF